MCFTIIMSLMSILVRIIPVISLAQNESIIRALPWTVATGTSPSGQQMTVYIGLTAYVIDVGGNRRLADETLFKDSMVSWRETSCTKRLTGQRRLADEPVFCEECKNAALGSVTIVIFSLVTSIVGMKSDLQRARGENDRNCAKFLAIFSGIMSSLSQLSALLAFPGSCNGSLPSNISASLGAGWWCLMVAFFMKAIIITMHCVVQVPEKHWSRDDAALPSVV